MNIIQNAVQYSFEGKIMVYVLFDRTESKLVLIINDQGVGIKKEDQHTIFQALSSMPKNYDKNKFRLSDGNQIGLGLFISK
jgi:signal transduction histidine kinase